MLEIKKIHESGFFQIRNLKEWEYLFHEWETDDNLYIVQEWELEIQKKIVTQNYNYKNLWKITEWSIVWEWSFFEKVEKKFLLKQIVLRPYFLSTHNKILKDLISPIPY